jgi:hypothetical protein
VDGVHALGECPGTCVATYPDTTFNVNPCDMSSLIGGYNIHNDCPEGDDGIWSVSGTVAIF